MNRFRSLQIAFLFILVFFSQSFFVSAQESKKELSREEIQKLYFDFLKQEGYMPEIDSDGDVFFKSEGFSYFIQVNEKDPEYFRLVLPNIWPIESEQERVKVVFAADEANLTSKTAKVSTNRDNVWVTIELFVTTPDGFKPVFKRSLGALKNGANTFAQIMNKKKVDI